MSITRAQIRPIEAEATRGLRHSVLRPGQSLEACVYPQDEAPATAHFGAYEGDRLVGVASLYCEDHEKAGRPNAWRLRGVAVDPSSSGEGVGRDLLTACLEFVHLAGGTVLWANVREPAAGFYAHFGFRRLGGSFLIPEIGPHYLMERELEQIQTFR